MTSCVSFDSAAANRLPRSAGRAFTVPSDFGASPGQWWLWSRPVRLAHLRSRYTRDYTRETADAYEARLRSMETLITAKAFASRVRPAGAGTNPYLGENLAGGASDKNNPPGMSDAQVTSIATTVSGIIGMAATTIQTAMREAGSTERTLIENRTREKIAELGQQIQESRDPATTAALQSSLAEVERLRALITTGTGMSTGTIVALVIGGVVILAGGAYVLMNRPARHNPVITDEYGHKRFVPARWLRSPTAQRDGHWSK